MNGDAWTGTVPAVKKEEVMGQRFWVVGGDYADCRFKQLEPGTETVHGPYPDELQGAHGMAAPDLPRPLRSDDALLDLVEPELQAR